MDDDELELQSDFPGEPISMTTRLDEVPLVEPHD